MPKPPGAATTHEDELLRLALTKRVKIVGEAAKQVTRRPSSFIRRFRGRRLPGCGTAPLVGQLSNPEWVKSIQHLLRGWR